jgi:hypothetical protein
MEQDITGGSRRLAGVREHLERVRLFLGIALVQMHQPTRFRFLLAAVYSCRAITELMLEAAEEQEMSTFRASDNKSNRASLEAHIAPRLPFYSLIERIRIHDFHRFGIRPPDPNHREVSFQGPMRVLGGAGFVLTAEGPVTTPPGVGRVEFQRPLLINDGLFFDDEEKRFVSLEEIVTAFVKKVPALIAELEPNWK